MRMLAKQTRSEAAFTFAEMAVAVGVLGLLGLVFFQVLQTGLTLSAKNTAVNAAHEQARLGIVRLTRDLHASVSVPQLRDTTYAVVSSTPSPSASPGATPPTAAGVSFQNIASGPNFVWSDPGSSTLIMIHDGASQAIPGMRLIVPFWAIEDDIVKVTGASVVSHSNVWTAHAQESILRNKTPAFSGSTYAITYYTNRAMYVVQNGSYVADSAGDFNLVSGQYVQVAPGAGAYHYENGELHFYMQRYNSSTNTNYWSDTATVARYLSSPKPFSVPLNRYGGPDNRYVKVQISARDPKSTNRGYIATSSLLNTQIDYRSRLTIYQ